MASCCPERRYLLYLGCVSKVLVRFAAFPKLSSASNVFINDLVDFLELTDKVKLYFILRIIVAA